MLDFGWRIPFLLGILLGVVGIYVRRNAPETPPFERLQATGSVETAPLRKMWAYRTDMLRIVGIIAPFGVTYTFYLYYTPTYLTQELHHSASFGLLVSTTALFVVAILTPLVALLSDRIGRRPILLLACALPIVMTVPLFLILPHGSDTTAFIIILILATPVSLFCGAGPATVCELMPTRVRIAGVGVPYAFAAAFFSGFTPLIMTSLVRITGNPISVTGYVLLAAAAGLITMIFTPETANKELR
jgi:MHS family proline/betaine transporter-like MFS transporter